jgi:RNA polymerase sigma-70 factor (TIGR02943 family)
MNSHATAAEPDGPAASRCDPEQWVDRYGDFLFRYALVRLRDPEKAEDLVQEAFLAALKAVATFSGRSSERSWLIGILKNKIADHYRAQSRVTSFTDLEFYRDEESDRFTADGPFKGGWIHALGPLEWSPDPGASLDNAAFWKTFHDCTAKLPPNIARVFLLREMDEMETDQICDLLRITPNHLWVMLHRARMALRRCLETNWFGTNKGPGPS